MHFLSILAPAATTQRFARCRPLILLALIPLAMYFLMIRPQRRRMRDQQALQSSIGVGDEVITTSGIYGFITGDGRRQFWLEIDDNVQIRIARPRSSARSTPAPGTLPATDDSAPTATTTTTTDDDDEKSEQLVKRSRLWASLLGIVFVCASLLVAQPGRWATRRCSASTCRAGSR